MQKKVCIITMTGYSNYGNRLQNYALDRTCHNWVNDVETLWPKRNLKTRIKDVIKYFIPSRILGQKRYSKFKLFNKKYICQNIIRYNIRNFKKQKDKYDYFIVGSDQVWNFNYLSKCKEDGSFYLYFLQFSDKNKNIAYAPSIGTSELDKKYYKEYEKGLNNFKNLSCREETGKKIIKDIINRNVEVLVDPTMLLSANEWDKISKRPQQLDNLKSHRYILNYFLGELANEWKDEIDRIAKENDCEIINILDKSSPFYQTGPSEFLYLEKNAFLVCTDSFHSSVFSIIYDTPFVVFDRKQKGLEKMNSRIDTLLSKFNLEDRRFSGKITKDLLKCDYAEAKQILKKEQEKSINFLKKALDIK